MGEKPRFIVCFCTGACPGFAKLDFWDLVNFVRNALDLEYAIMHPQLCVEDGERFWRDILSEGKKGITYIVGGCDVELQRKLFNRFFREKGLDEKQLLPLDLKNMETKNAIKKVEEAISKLVGE